MAAKKLPITKVKIGNIIAEDITAANGIMLAPKGTVVTDSILELLDMNAIFMLMIEESPVIEQKVTPSHYEKLRESKEFLQFKEKYEQAVEGFRNSLNDIVEKNKSIHVKELLNQALDVYNSDTKNFSIMDFMMNIRDYDDSTFCHSLNVAMICRIFSDWLHWNEEEKELATLCGLLHDIGKIEIPDEIVKKPGKLTDQEYEIMKKHPSIGYRILEKQNIDVRIKKAALMHHEKCDGSGYPFGLKADQLDKYTKMITIVDIYDAMTSARVYRGPISPFEVVRQFETEGLQKYDPKMIICFLQNVADQFLNNKVILSNGNEGKIVYINKSNLSKPMVQCGDEFVDLASRLDLCITKMG